MTTTPDLGLPLIAGQQAQPEITHNEALILLQALLSGVLDRGVNTPPGGPTEGDGYIIGAAPTGAWAGKANKIAIFYGGSWRFVPDVDSNGTNIPIGARHEGMRVWVRDEDKLYVWTQAGSPPALTWVAPADAALPLTGGTLTGDLVLEGFLNFGTPPILTIAAGEITVTKTFHRVDTESGDPSDDLDTINGGSEGDILILRSAASARDVTIKQGTGNIFCAVDRVLNTISDRIVLQKSSGAWLMISYADN